MEIISGKSIHEVFYKTVIRLSLTLFLWNGGMTSSQGQMPPGYDLWLGYDSIEGGDLKDSYRSLTRSIYFESGSETLLVAKDELSRGLRGMLRQLPEFTEQREMASMVVTKSSAIEDSSVMSPVTRAIQENGFCIKTVTGVKGPSLYLVANDDQGLLYGVFRLLQLMQTRTPMTGLEVIDSPGVEMRLLNHWDNLDRTVERGYAGFSLWNWHKLPQYIDQRYVDYARANASIGINGTVLTNVNANAQILTPLYLTKVAALADVFRPYGIKVYLTARFSAPIEIGGLETADPLNNEVRSWWKHKVDEIYQYVPDFGGFLVKANSEGQPGPQNYSRNHVDGANMLAETLAAHEGVVMWRAFVYSENDPTDRAKQAYNEFVPFDGQFEKNVLIQSKNGAIDFQPREPFHPLFGAMPQTPLMMEFQITQEYLGFSSHLVFLPKLFEEVLQADTYRNGGSAQVARVIDGTLHGTHITGMAGVANIGTDLNWTGHPFGQANWYGFGRLAWDPDLSAETIAEEWLKATYSPDPDFVRTMKGMMLLSREAVVNYMTPLGLHHLFDTGHHYGPGPWVDDLDRPEWNPTYYHKADATGIGFDRTGSGSHATAQYAPRLEEQFNDPQTCPEELLLWFHHLPWDYRLKGGQTLWEGLAFKYQEGVDQVREMIEAWEEVKHHLTPDEHREVQMLLAIQLKEARWWKDASLLYFQTFSQEAIPEGIEKPEKTLEYYQSLKFPFAPGIRPRWD